MKRIARVFHPSMTRRAGIIFGLLPLLLGMAACHSSQDAVTSANNSAALPGNGSVETYRVRAAEASFYHISPLQAAGPDEQLKKDTEVTMIKASRAYSRVKTSRGDTGYVATEDIAPLTTQEIAAANTLASTSSIQAQLESQRQTAARGMGGDGYTIPPEAGSQEKLPEPDARPNGPKVNTGASATPTPDPLFHR